VLFLPSFEPPAGAFEYRERGAVTTISRRSLLSGAVAAAVAGASRAARSASTMPVAFVSHGSPLLAIDPVRGPHLDAWGRALAKPTAILVMTPHYATRRLELGRTGRGFAMYDMPRWLARQLPQNLEYASPPSDALADRVEALLGPVTRGRRRGFDHTTWIPLSHLRPQADVPVLELALPYFREPALFRLGKRLAPLKDEGVLFLASGGVTHNLASLGDGYDRVPAWSSEFDAWTAETVSRWDADAIIDWRRRAPASDLAHPDDGGHFRVLVVALGVALGGTPSPSSVAFPDVGYEGTLSTRCIQLG
jgi:4,5-DOPA dioxygenase extradiol